MKIPSRGFVADEELKGKRLDQVLASLFPEHSRSAWQKLIVAGQVLINGEAVKGKYKLKAGDPVTIHPIKKDDTDKDIKIIYEDENVLVLDKPASILTHSKSTIDTEPTVVDFIQDKISFSRAGLRDGIVHRLDRDTSGVLITAKNEEAQQFLADQFKNKTVEKQYIALIEGTPKEDKAILKWNIERNPSRPHSFRVGPNGKESITKYEVVKKYGDYALVNLYPKTGRTHQLRVHMANLGCPIVSDNLYGSKSKLVNRQFLHAQSVSIKIPGKGKMTFKSLLPDELKGVLDNLSE